MTCHTGKSGLRGTWGLSALPNGLRAIGFSLSAQGNVNLLIMNLFKVYLFLGFKYILFNQFQHRDEWLTAPIRKNSESLLDMVPGGRKIHVERR